MKVIIAGGRDFKDYELLKRSCDNILVNQKDIEIVSGCASGADRFGEKYAIECGYNIHHFPADWINEGRSAGYKRNRDMAMFSDALIAFWNGKSPGTGHMINLAREFGLKIRIIKYDT